MCVCWVGWGVAVICAQAFARACVCTIVERGVRGEVRVWCYNWTRLLKSCKHLGLSVSSPKQLIVMEV